MLSDRSAIRYQGGIRQSSAFLLIVLLILGCGVGGRRDASVVGSAPKPIQDPLMAARRILITDLTGRSAEYYPAPDSSTLNIIVDTSGVVNGLVYYWGEYHPRGTADVVFRSLAAVRAQRVGLIRTPADLVAIIGEGRVPDVVSAIDECTELVYATSTRRTPDVRPYVFRDAASFSRVARPVPDRSIVSRLQAPSLIGDANELRADFWAIERRDVRKYRCTLMPGSADVQVLDSLPGYGFVS